MGPIGSAVLTLIGYKQTNKQTDRQAKFIYRFKHQGKRLQIEKSSIRTMMYILFELFKIEMVGKLNFLRKLLLDWKMSLRNKIFFLTLGFREHQDILFSLIGTFLRFSSNKSCWIKGVN